MSANLNIPAFSTEPIELNVQIGQPLTIKHGLGREIAGWVVIWATAPVYFYIQDQALSTREKLVLIPSNSARVRLILL